MISISEHIEYLIHRHDCVVVPGWGAFIAQYQPAILDAAKGIINPPTRSVAFNASVTHNDGLLITSITRRESISYNDATKAIANEVEVMRYQLEHDKEVALGHIGVFRKEKGTMIFEPLTSNFISSAFIGLPSVKISALSSTGQDKRTETTAERKKKDVIYLPISRNIFKAVASFAILIGLGITLSTPVILDEQHSNYASFSSIKVTAPEKARPIFNEPAPDAELFIAMPDATEAISIADTTVHDISSNLIQTDAFGDFRCNDSDSYCLIVASLASRELAEEYISERGNQAMHILETGGKYRIYVATGATTAQALEPTHSESFSAQYPAAWVCRR